MLGIVPLLPSFWHSERFCCMFKIMKGLVLPVRQEGFARAQRQLAEETLHCIPLQLYALSISRCNLVQVWVLVQTYSIMSTVQEARQSVSIFVDNLNISMGCQVLSTGRDSSQRLRMPAFSEVVAGARTVASRMVVDHWTRGNHRVCWLWQLCGFWVERSASMADCILAHIRSLRGHDRNQVLALCTGDGRHVDIVRYLVRRGWTIEIWCWRESCHSDYLALDESHRNLRICYLDGFRPQVTMARTREFPHLPDRQETQAVVLGAREADQDHHQGYRYQGVLVREDDAVPEPPQQPQQVEDVDLCTFCYSEEATFAFRPCNHRVLCANCAQDVMQRFHRNQELRLSANMNRCFLCRAPWIRLNRDR